MRSTYRSYRESGRRQRRWSADNPGNEAIRAELLAAIERQARSQLRKAGPILDAGCGSGYWLTRMAERGVPAARLHGVDLIDERVRAARAAVPRAAIDVGDVTALPYPDRTFELVLLLTVLSSLPDRAAVRDALGEVRRVLAPGGVAVVYEPRLPTPNRATARIRSREVAAGVGPSRQLETLTLAPPLARRLGARTDRLYPRLARAPLLRTHWIGAFAAGGQR